MHVKVAHLTHELDGLDRPLLVARRRRWKRSISDGIMMFSEDRWKHWMDTCTHDAQPLTHPSTTQQQTHRRSDAMAPIPSTLALSAKGGGGGRAIAITPRDAALLATGLLGGAFVVSHLYFLLKKRHASLCSFLRLLGLGGGLEGGMDPATGRLLYPKTARGSTVDVLHGVAVPDPYRWLEDPDARAVRAWVAAQNRTSDAYFGTLKDEKEKFRARMHELYHYDKYSCVWRKGDRYFFYKKAGLQNQSVLYTQDSLGGAPRVLVDPNTLRADGTAALSSVHLSDDASKLAYMVAFSGSDWQTIMVMDVASGKPLPDEIHWCKFSSVAWTKDGAGFFYAKYPPPSSKGKDDGAGTETEAAASQKIYYHRLGTPESADQLFFADAAHPKWLFGVETSEDGDTLLLTMSDSCDPVNGLFYFDLRGFDGKDVATVGRCVKLVGHFEHKYDYITNEGRRFFFRTNRDGAAKYKVVKISLPPAGDAVEEDPAALAQLPFEEVVPPDTAKGGVLMDAQAVAGSFLLLHYLRDVVDELEVCPLDSDGGAAAPARVMVPLPGKGALESVCCRKEQAEFFFKYTSFNDPGTVYRAEIKTSQPTASGPSSSSPDSAADKAGGGKKKGGKGGKGSKASSGGKESTAGAGGVVEIPTSLVFRSVIAGLDPEEYVTTQVFYSSKDGTKVPMFLVRGKEATATATARPTFLYGYGGFNISVRPSFSLSRLLFIKHFGGVVAVANIRGGGEYGEEWHNGGTKHNKQNVFDDFIAAAEFLVREGVSTPKQIAINGGSNGGLLVAACINQRPELFGAAVAQVGVLDMLRFHKFTIGYAWCSDYGNADDDKGDFECLYRYSPVHNVNTAPGVVYPATLITTGDHDDRVVPLHSYKYIAALQHAHGQRATEEGRPLVIRIDTKAGHGAGKPTSKLIDEQSDVFAFIARNTGAAWRD